VLDRRLVALAIGALVTGALVTALADDAYA
jgi:hypothetical protein